MRELRNRVGYLLEVGLGYLTVERQARTLSGGEAQRIHLASALGSVLVGTLYALDEPTVGLHASDARRLLAVLYSLRDLRQHGDCRRARSCDDRGRGLRRRAWPGRRQRGRRADVLGTAGKRDARQHGVVAGTCTADARDCQAAQIQPARSRDSNNRGARAPISPAWTWRFRPAGWSA